MQKPVKVPGPDHPIDVAPYLQAADLFVLPSAAEGLSNALLEAMATGLPCVATAVGGAPEVVTGGETGLLVPPGEPERLLEAVVALMADAERRAELGRGARRTVETRYALSVVAARLLALYREVVEA